jgi:hypothetical protein
VEHQLVGGDRLAQAQGQLELFLSVPLAGVVDAGGVAPSGLRLVHRGVGVLEQRLRVVGIEREQADPDARVDVELHAADREWLLQRAAHALRRLLGGCRGFGEQSRKISHQQEELVAAVPADDVVRSGGAAQASGDGG